MSHRLGVQRRTATSMPPVQDDSRLDAKEVQPPASPAPAPAPAHDFATLDIASADQLASLADPEVQRTHLRIQPREPRFQWGAGRSVQRSTDDPGQPSSSADLGQRIRAAQGGGSPLEPTVQERLESGLGADLSGVRVHTDGEAAQLSQAVSATAFTTGSHIFFQSGAYRPHSGEGMRVLAHEAAHTVQQARGPVDGTPGPGGVSISDPSDSFKQAAETAAQRVVSGHSESPAVQLSTGGHPATGAVPVQRILEWLKFWKKSPPPPAKAPAEEVLPALEEASAQDSEAEQVAPAAPAPAAEPISGSIPYTAQPDQQDYPGAQAAAPAPAAEPISGSIPYTTQPDKEDIDRAEAQVAAPAPAAKPETASLDARLQQGGKYKTKELIERFRGAGEKRAQQKWAGDKYVGQMGFLYEKERLALADREKVTGKPQKAPRAVKYLTPAEREQYEVRIGKDDNLFYWRGELFTTIGMKVVGRKGGAEDRVIFVMTDSGKIYAANEGAESQKGLSGRGEERWRFNHSSFLWGEPVAAAGELIFKKGVLTGITDMSGHYQPGLEYTRQVVQVFAAQGIDLSGVQVMLSEKSDAEGAWYVPAQMLIDNPGFSEEDFRQTLVLQQPEQAAKPAPPPADPKRTFKVADKPAS